MDINEQNNDEFFLEGTGLGTEPEDISDGRTNDEDIEDDIEDKNINDEAYELEENATPDPDEDNADEEIIEDFIDSEIDGENTELSEELSSAFNPDVLPDRRLTNDELYIWATTYYSRSGANAFELEVIRLINIERASRDLSPVTLDERLSMAGRFYAQTKHQYGRGGHNVGPYADDPTAQHGASANVARAFGGNLRWNGGNSAWGHPTAVSVVNGWMNSPGHFNYIVSPEHNHIGVGRVGTYTYMFLAQNPSSSTPPLPSPPVITTNSLPGGTAGTAYNQTLTATSVSAVTWSIENGVLPPGLSLNATTGVISGIPTRFGSYTFTIRATRTLIGTNTQLSSTKQFTITINGPDLSISQTGTYTFPDASFNYTSVTSFSVNATNSGNAPTGELSIALSGTNSADFELSTQSLGTIAPGGSASFNFSPKLGLSPGEYTATVSVSGAIVGTTSFSISFTVNKAEGPDAPVAPTVSSRTTTSITLASVPGIEYAMSLTNRAPIIGWQDGDEFNAVTFNNLAQNVTYYFFARVKETATHLASAASTPLPVMTNAIPTSISISPMYSVAKVGQTEPFDLQVILPHGVVADSIYWNVGSGVLNYDSPYNPTIRLTVGATSPVRQAVTVAVTIDSVVYIAHAEVNIVADASIEPGDRTARLADNTAVINRAKKDEKRSVEVPIVLNYMPADTTVKLYRNYDPSKPASTVELTGESGPLTAELSNNSTAIEINYKAAVEKNESFKGVTVVIGNSSNPYDESNVVATGTLNISVINRFPQRLVAIVDQLDLFYRNETEITLVDADGVVYEVDKIELRGNPKLGELFDENKRVRLKDSDNRTGTIPVRVTVDPGDYTSLKAGGNTHDINIRVVNNTPSLRLSTTTVTLLDKNAENPGGSIGAATIRLLTRNLRIPFESYYEIEDVKPLPRTGKDELVKVDYISRDGFGELIISPKEGEEVKAGRINLEVSFNGTDWKVLLPLTIRVANPKNLSPSPSTRTVTVNASHTPGTDIVTLPINLNAANLVLDWQVIRVGGKSGSIDSAESVLKDHIDFRDEGNNMITFSVNDGADLDDFLDGAKSRSIQVRIGSDTLNSISGKKSFVTVTLRIVSTPASFTISQKGRIDIANPESAIDATIKLQNTSERILDVRLLEQNRDDAGNQIEPTDISTLFEAVHIPGENTFRIVAIDNVVPRFRYSLAIEVELESRTLTSWKEIEGTDRVTYKPNLNITPIQTQSKAWRSADNVTLRAAMPHTGDDIRLNLTTPANVRLGHVNIQQASLDNLYFIKADPDDPSKWLRDPDNPNNHVFFEDSEFEIIQNGGNSWTIRFKYGEVPWGTTNKAGTARTPLKSSYNIRLELWAEGTYVLDDDGNPTALVHPTSKKPASKPTLVTVKVNIRP